MNVIFMGTPEFAVPSLSSLAASAHKIIRVITQPDRPKGRSKTPCPSPVKKIAQDLGLEILQPANVNDEAVIKELRDLSPDCIVVVAFGQLLSYSIIHLPRYQCVNIHSSLLPKLRGAAPINWAIIRGESVTGVTVMVMTVKMDAGDIILQKTIPIVSGENAGELEKRLAPAGAELLLEALDLIENGKATYTRQDENEVTFAPKIKKGDGLISWSQETEKIHNHIRGLTPAPGAYTFSVKSNTAEKKRIIVKKTNICDMKKTKTSFSPGTVIEIAPCGIHVATLDGFICITRLQPEGKREMGVQEYIHGYKTKANDTFIS
ncbi:MAG: methionyl-tRNA formyltransferase [Candidatus Brocadiaceae bacterium]|nr:methionyl-tRNA formyltransferase [Candidatus Brocadiaceae bacterium]